MDEEVERVGKILERYTTVQNETKERLAKLANERCIEIQIGDATCENAAGSQVARNEFEKLIEASGRKDIVIKKTGCTGRCSAEPIVGVLQRGRMPFKYQSVTAEKVRRIFTEHILGGQPVIDFLLDKKTKNKYRHQIAFFKNGAYTGQDVFDAAGRAASRLANAGVQKEEVKIGVSINPGLFIAHESLQYYMIIFPEEKARNTGSTSDADVTRYGVTKPADLDRIIDSHLLKGEAQPDLFAAADPLFDRYLKMYADIEFFNRQTRFTLRNSGIIDPENIDEYIFYDGFAAAARVLDGMSPQEVVEAVKKSGLRGRGGAGFLTGLKWEFAQKAATPKRFIICNADEGDPGAFMDRSTLEGDPFSIVEGMIIGAYATGASQGYCYIRAEYPLAIKRVEKAIEMARAQGFLGKNILGSDFSFDLEIRLGAGAFVCGEETALMHSIEGRRGQPRTRPPFPAASGLWGCPTTINNVETWANVPVIFLNGPEWFARLGSEKSKGTKVFALAGKVINTGLVEVPMGTTLREVIFDIGGGIPGGKVFKAVQTGGPSGGCIPESLIDTEVDYDSLAAIGSIMGSGGMIVVDEDSCMVDVAKYFLEFTMSESCGKCTPCREGTLRMYEILERITRGEARDGDIERLERLANLIKKTALCGLGQTAPNPVLSTLQHFRNEYELHVHSRRCPAKVCKKLIQYEVNPEKCIGCSACARACPTRCISGKPKTVHTIDAAKCIHCGECFTTCKFDAIRKN
ncbi:MAG: NADH-quinone oxidoreductase subunit NuoF [Spirochaetota bacterium]|nr:NADH-quinone oxidoreductase subunit NuoF [Spirochaetota bacterium]